MALNKDNRSYPHGPGSLWQGPVHSLDGFWFPAFATADAPPAALYPEIVIILTDGGAGGGAALARSDGTDWTAFEGGSGGGPTTVDWANVTNTPTTIAGYGITDAFSGAYGDLTGVPTTFAPTTGNTATTAMAGNKAASVTNLTDSSGGTSGGDTIAALANADPTVENAIATLAAKVNALLTALKA